MIGLHSLRMRCNVTTIDPDTGHQDLDVFRRLRTEFGGQLALNAWAVEPGTIRVGDRVTRTETDAAPHHLGGWIVGAPYPGLGG